MLPDGGRSVVKYVTAGYLDQHAGIGARGQSCPRRAADIFDFVVQTEGHINEIYMSMAEDGRMWVPQWKSRQVQDYAQKPVL